VHRHGERAGLQCSKERTTCGVVRCATPPMHVNTRSRSAYARTHA
jgi:hypothetical protein